MTRRRWIADEVSGNRAALVGAHADHLVRVLRARVGQEFDVATGSVVRRGKVAAVANDRVEFELGDEIPAIISVRVTLFLAIFKFDRMEWAIEKCTELGVSRIIPVIARRTDAHLASASAKRVERWRRLALQSAEQSRREAPPEIDDPIEPAQAASYTGALKIVLAESEQETMLREVAASHSGDEVALAVGPEGGWSDDELQLFLKTGWISASLGSRILRAETAAIVAAALVVSEFSVSGAG
jgi:16S rRNA (uracil1498-N3)-methyltransferase